MHSLLRCASRQFVIAASKGRTHLVERSLASMGSSTKAHGAWGGRVSPAQRRSATAPLFTARAAVVGRPSFLNHILARSRNNHGRRQCHVYVSYFGNGILPLYILLTVPASLPPAIKRDLGALPCNTRASRPV
jgi:hypothetical protein